MRSICLAISLVGVIFGVAQSVSTDNELTKHREMLRSADVQTRLRGVQFIGEKKDQNSVPLLVQVLRNDQAYSVKAWAAWALAEIRDPAAIDPLIASLERSEKLATANIFSEEYKCMAEIDSALYRLTGQDFTNSKEWRSWREKKNTQGGERASCAKTLSPI